MQRSSFLPSTGCLAVCAQPRPPPNVRAASGPAYGPLYHPPSSALLPAQWWRRQREILGQSSTGRWPILRRKKKKKKNDDDGDGGRETWGQHLSCIGRPPLRSLISPASSHIKVTPGCIIPASHFHSDYTGNVFIQDGNPRALLARIIMPIEIMHLASSDIMQINVFTFRLCLDP